MLAAFNNQRRKSFSEEARGFSIILQRSLPEWRTDELWSITLLCAGPSGHTLQTWDRYLGCALHLLPLSVAVVLSSTIMTSFLSFHVLLKALFSKSTFVVNAVTWERFPRFPAENLCNGNIFTFCYRWLLCLIQWGNSKHDCSLLFHFSILNFIKNMQFSISI